MVGGGLALMIVPGLHRRSRLARGLLERRAAGGRRDRPYSGRDRTAKRRSLRSWVLRDRALLPLGVLQAATFGLAVVAGNWAVPLLERQGASSAAAGLAGGLVLSIGIVTRPTGD